MADVRCNWHGVGMVEGDQGWSCPACPNPAEVARLRADLTEAVDACRYALADSPRWQELAETVVHTSKEASS